MIGNLLPDLRTERFWRGCPATVEEGFQARKKEFQYAIDRNLVYSPAMHPWSVYRFDPELKHIEWLIEMAHEENVPIMNCYQLYEKYRNLAAAA